MQILQKGGKASTQSKQGVPLPDIQHLGTPHGASGIRVTRAASLALPGPSRATMCCPGVALSGTKWLPGTVGSEVASEHCQIQRHLREPDQWEQGMWSTACTWDSSSDPFLGADVQFPLGSKPLRYNTHILHSEKGWMCAFLSGNSQLALSCQDLTNLSGHGCRNCGSSQGCSWDLRAAAPQRLILMAIPAAASSN